VERAQALVTVVAGCIAQRRDFGRADSADKSFIYYSEFSHRLFPQLMQVLLTGLFLYPQDLHDNGLGCGVVVLGGGCCCGGIAVTVDGLYESHLLQKV